jgi:UDP-N-acetylmuramoylalanine--D-glutamate ligase
MIDYLKSEIGNKRVLILGFGREGRSTLKLFSKYFPDLIIGIADADAEIKNDAVLANFRSDKLHLGENYLDSIRKYNFIIKSPGVSVSGIMIPENIVLSSQTALFIQFYRNQIIGVSGTKGKSTCSSLINFLLSKLGRESVLLGNIGKPAFDSIEIINEKTIIVFELSAHQLENVNVSPHIAVLLNIFPEHLDYFGDLQKYQKAKLNIGKYQTSDDFIIHSLQLNSKVESDGVKLSFGFESICDAFFDGVKLNFTHQNEKSLLSPNNISLRGNHNYLNVMAALLSLKALGINFKDASRFVGDFKGLPHRLEYVGKFRGIHFYNDSISTVPQSGTEAVNTLKIVDTLILGGYDRGLDYADFAVFLNNSDVRNFVFLGKAGDSIFNEMSKQKLQNKNFFKVRDLEHAFEIIWQKTKKDGICLLSPAAASYDQFKNFEHRGNLFTELAKKS